MSKQTVCVFCGSISGLRPAYAEAARRVGALLAEQGCRVVTGGSKAGLMGAVADAALEHGGQVIGVFPDIAGFPMRTELLHPRLTELRFAPDLATRVQDMINLSDAFVALPGGLGTLEEVLQVLTLKQLGLHRKPMVLVDIEGYWAPLLGLLTSVVDNGFAYANLRELLQIVTRAEDVLPAILRAQPDKVLAIDSAQALRVHLPQLADRLDSSEEALARTSDDFGHLVSDRPLAVLRPRAAEDVELLVRTANAARLGVAARGQGGSNRGQAQVRGGVVIDMSGLSRIESPEGMSVWVEPGVTWRELVRKTLEQGLTPPVLTDYTDLSVGGTLSVGGLGMQSFRSGLQADNVLELEVVTGSGQRVLCSAERHRDLFDACRAGLGQFGIITRARVALARAPTQARLYRLLYTRLEHLLEDLGMLTSDGRFHGLASFALPGERGLLEQRFGAEAMRNTGELPSWVFMTEFVRYFEPAQPPNDRELLGGLRALEGCSTARDMSYFDFVNRLDPQVARLRAAGHWETQHPWTHVLVPAQHAAGFISSVLAELRYEDMGAGPILIAPLEHRTIQAPFFRLPEGERSVMLAVLCNPRGAAVDRMRALGDHLDERARACGGTRYLIDTPLTPRRAVAHFGPLWERLLTTKHRYDCRHILTPNQKLFGEPT
jgi:uncharacterized protein (TIGR00730 family)